MEPFGGFQAIARVCCHRLRDNHPGTSFILIVSLPAYTVECRVEGEVLEAFM